MSRTAMVNIDTYKLKKYIALSGMQPAEISTQLWENSDYLTRSLREEKMSAKRLNDLCFYIGISAENVIEQDKEEVRNENNINTIDSIELLCDFLIEGIEKFRGYCEETKEVQNERS